MEYRDALGKIYKKYLFTNKIGNFIQIKVRKFFNPRKHDFIWTL